MQQAKFVFIIFFTLLQLIIILHSSILTYVEQQYHNFTESPHAFTRFFGTIYQETMLQDNVLFRFTDESMAYLENLSLSLTNQTLEILGIASSKKSLEKVSINTHNITPSQDSTPFAHHTDSQAYANKTPTQQYPTDTLFQSEQNKEQEIQTIDENTHSFFAHNTEKTHHQALTYQEENSNTNTIAEQNIEEKPIVESYTPVRTIRNPRIHIDENSSVLLVGDSMMQGVAPYILKTFKKVHLHGINLSKHSTGLTYKNYFDWAKAIEEVFTTHDNIELVVVLLGANDPWTMKKNIAFKSAKWEEIYLQRIEEILSIAQSHGARVVWYEVPSVREKSLNEKIIYLNSLYERKVRENGELFLQSNGIVTQGGHYSAFIKNKKGKSVQVRIDDGVHFTALGYQIMANIFLNALEVLPKQETTHQQMEIE